jgi:hypothetical protein
MSPRTLFLSRLIGLFTTVIALSMIANRDGTLTAFITLLHDPAALWVTGVLGLGAGLALVLCHTQWSGGAPAIVVTLVGWITLIKSILVLVLPHDWLGAMSDWLQSPAFFYADAAFILALGLYLTSAGFRTSHRQTP